MNEAINMLTSTVKHPTEMSTFNSTLDTKGIESDIHAETSLNSIHENHAEILKKRAENFFRELTDLIIIDNAYRGIV